MNNDKSNIKGSNVRRAVIFLLLAGFCVALFAPSAAASQWSPTKTFPDRDRIVIRPEYDEGGWTQPNQDKPHKFDPALLRFLRWMWIGYYDNFIDVGDQVEDIQDENESTDDEDTTANRNYGSF